MTDSTQQQAAAAWANKVDRAANDPARIEKRKSITPTITVPRHRG